MENYGKNYDYYDEKIFTKHELADFQVRSHHVSKLGI